jgi:tetratricopeptide (TPR) repeat protein
LRLRRILWITLVLASCARRSPPVETTAPPSASLSLSTPAPAPPVPASWFENDYAGALAQARSRNVPLFVDASAVWCHTCLAMRAFVLDEPALEKSAFVWFSFDVERPGNDALAARYPAKVLPTFFVVDPANEAVHGRWEGAATVDQMRDFLRDARRSIELSHAGALPPSDPLALLLAGHRAAITSDHETASRRFAEALRAAPPAWSRRPDALLALIAALERGKKPAACLELALETLPGAALGRSSTLADFSATALSCAADAPSSPRARALRELVAKQLREVARDPVAPLSPDDRGDAFRIVWDAEEALGHHDGALAAARERLEVLDAAARRAPNAAVASTFDGARLETLVFLGRAPEAVRFLTERERELPDDYNPAHRLASAYQALGEHEKALLAIDRAIAKAWGARKARMLDKRADILVALGRNGEARKALESELSHLASLPATQKKPELEASARKRLEKLAAP